MADNAPGTDDLGSLARGALLLIGGYFVTKGALTPAQEMTVVNGIVTGVAALIPVASLAWSFWRNRQHRQTVQVALYTPPPIGPVPPEIKAVINAGDGPKPTN